MATVTTEIVKASDKPTTASYTYVYVEIATKEFRRISIGDFITATSIVTTNTAQNITAAKTFYINTATTEATQISFIPTDWGVGKPGLFLKKTTTADTWQWYLWDGATTNGTLEIICGTLELNGSPVVTEWATQTLYNKTIDGGTIQNVTSVVGSIVETVVTTTGAGSWNKPANLLYLEVIAVGGGGGGGGADGDSSGAMSGIGGGGGGYVYKKYAAADLSATENYSVGAKGTGGLGTANGGAGGDTTFKGLTAAGGAGGTGRAATATNAFSGANGGAASGGDINIAGQNSTSVRIVSNLLYTISNGGSSVKGFGGAGGDIPANGVNATGYGGGGSGATVNSSTSANYTGGDGTDGVLILREYRST